jgi:hypothetical protein
VARLARAAQVAGDELARDVDRIHAPAGADLGREQAREEPRARADVGHCHCGPHPRGGDDGVALLVDLPALGFEAFAPLLLVRVAVWGIDLRRGALACRQAESENSRPEKAESAHGAG